MTMVKIDRFDGNYGETWGNSMGLPEGSNYIITSYHDLHTINMLSTTLPEANIAPENRPSQKEN